MNPIRQEIIRKIMHNPSLTFNQLWDKDIPSNKFAYHLKILEEDGFIEKKEECYVLSHEGKKFVAFIDGKSGEQASKPLLGVAVVVERNGKVLMLQRRKEPFYGYWGFPSGKIEFNQYILEAAAAELKEETGMEAELKVRGLFSSKTYNGKTSEDAQSYNHQLFIVRGENPKGNLLETTREGYNKWVLIDEVKNMNIFPDVVHLMLTALQDNFKMLEVDRYLENDIFLASGEMKETIF